MYLREMEHEREKRMGCTKMKLMDSNKRRLFCHGHHLDRIAKNKHQNRQVII